MTMRSQILQVLGVRHHPMTATTICNAINVPDGISDFIGFELSSVSSTLRKMYDTDVLGRVENFGPRGGYGYYLKHREQET